jgi:drug/metabolite transporter (DMT)-like permease
MAALGLALAGLGVLVLGRGVAVGLASLPGVACALAAAILFSAGTVAAKRWPLGLPPASAAAWQIALGVAPLGLGALLVEAPDFSALSAVDWGLLAYGGAGPLGLCYLAWFAALRRLPAAAAASGTLGTPIVGVLAAAALLGEPFGLREALALTLTLTGVVLALRG